MQGISLLQVSETGLQMLSCLDRVTCQTSNVAFCTNDANLTRFSLSSASFGWDAYCPTYDPWEIVDDFGRSKIDKSLLATYRSIHFGPSGSSVQMEVEEGGSVRDEAALRVPSGGKRRRQDRSKPRSASSSVAGDHPSGSSIC